MIHRNCQWRVVFLCSAHNEILYHVHHGFGLRAASRIPIIAPQIGRLSIPLRWSQPTSIRGIFFWDAWWAPQVGSTLPRRLSRGPSAIGIDSAAGPLAPQPVIIEQ